MCKVRLCVFFFFSSRRRHTRLTCDWSSDVCSSDLNGAGKSTLVKVLCGAIHPDGGVITLSGKPVHFADPLDAQRHGIETVYQDLSLAPDLDAAANLHLGREVYRGGVL